VPRQRKPITPPPSLTRAADEATLRDIQHEIDRRLFIYVKHRRSIDPNDFAGIPLDPMTDDEARAFIAANYRALWEHPHILPEWLKRRYAEVQARLDADVKQGRRRRRRRLSHAPSDRRKGSVTESTSLDSDRVLERQDYEGLFCRLLSLITAHLALPSSSDLELHKQQVAIAVCEATEMTPEHWAGLTQPERVPWLQKTVAAVEKQKQAGFPAESEGDFWRRLVLALRDEERLPKGPRGEPSGPASSADAPFRRLTGADPVQMERYMSFDPILLKALEPEFKQLAAEFPDEFVAFAKFENATGADPDWFTPVYRDLANRTLRPNTWLVGKRTITDPDGKTKVWTAQPPSWWLQFAAGQEQEFLLWENEHSLSKFEDLAARAWNCLPEGMHVPKPLCHFADTPQLLICRNRPAEFWPNFVANLLRDSGKFVVVENFPDHHAEVAYLTNGLFQASVLAIKRVSAGANSASQEDYVTLDQIAAMVSRSKRTLEKYKSRKTNPMPAPDVEGGGGRPAEWNWSKIRLWLIQEFGRQLPEIPYCTRISKT